MSHLRVGQGEWKNAAAGERKQRVLAEYSLDGCRMKADFCVQNAPVPIDSRVHSRIIANLVMAEDFLNGRRIKADFFVYRMLQFL